MQTDESITVMCQTVYVCYAAYWVVFSHLQMRESIQKSLVLSALVEMCVNMDRNAI